MYMKNRYCLIMAGGVGTRFWPMSTSKKPKQFLDILNIGKSMLQLTFERFLKHCLVENIWIITNDKYKSLVLQQLPEIKSKQVLTEPFMRNTAVCIAYASYKIAKQNSYAQMIVTPSDHQITNMRDFSNTIEKGFEFISTNRDCLLTLGITPSRPETAYGYIQFDNNLNEKEIKKVKTFTEKPNYKMATVFVNSGEFLWNSGMFMWSISAICKAFEEYLPDIHQLFSKAQNKFYTEEEKGIIKKIYKVCQIISIDYGIMEKSKNVYVLKTKDIGWSDIGTWTALYEQLKHDENNNVVSGKNTLVKFYDSKNCFITSNRKKFIIAEGLDNYFVIETDKILLIFRKDDEHIIRKIMTDIEMEFGKKYT